MNRSVRTWLSAFALATAVALAATDSAGATFPGRNGLLVFREQSLLVVDPARPERVRRLRTDCPGERCSRTDPRWSPGGRRLAFILTARGTEPGLPQGKIALARPDRTGLQLTGITAGYLAWSPDGSRFLVLVHAGTVEGLEQGIYVVDRETGVYTELENSAGGDWSSRDRITFSNDGSIFTVRPNGRERRALIRNGDSARPSWSPDGTRIAFDRASRARSGGGIWVMDSDGRNKRQIVKRRGALWPVWSPDGRWIAYILGSSVCVIRSDGSGRSRRLYRSFLQNPSPVGGLDWQPLRGRGKARPVGRTTSFCEPGDR